MGTLNRLCAPSPGLGWGWGYGSEIIPGSVSYLFNQYVNPQGYHGPAVNPPVIDPGPVKTSSEETNVTQSSGAGSESESASGGIFGMNNTTLLLIGGALILLIYFLKK